QGTVTLDGLTLRQFFDVIGDERLQAKFYGPKAAMVFHAGPDQDFVLMPLTRDDYKPAPKPAPEAKPAPEPPQAGGEGGVTTGPRAPEPPVPVGATPDAHQGNGAAKPRGKAK